MQVMTFMYMQGVTFISMQGAALIYFLIIKIINEIEDKQWEKQKQEPGYVDCAEANV